MLAVYVKKISDDQTPVDTLRSGGVHAQWIVEVGEGIDCHDTGSALIVFLAESVDGEAEQVSNSRSA
jgi:hypothetical protein